MSHPPFLELGLRSPQAAWAAQAAMPAVVAGYPLLESVRTCRLQTLPGAVAYGRAPLNTLGHSAERWTDRDRDIVTPANDLLYSSAWIDLRQGPVVITVPAPTGRYFVLELLDVYTNNFLNLGTRNVPAAGARFALMGPAHGGEPPVGCIPVRCPTELVWLLGRVLVDDDADVPPARAFQAGFTMNGPDIATPPASVSNWQDTGDEALDFYANLARALHDFPPPPEQRGPFDLLRGAHVELGPDGWLGDLRPAVVEGLRAGYAAAMRTIEGHTRAASKAPWRYSTRLGRYGNDLMLRAATAFKGLGALAADEAIYAVADYDSQGERLDGSHVYRMRFADGGQVPADAFWSVTLYGDDRFLAPNPIGRHALGNRSPLVRDADGALTLHIAGHEPPGPSQNWLPAPAAGFYLIARLYHPRQSFLDGHYRLPELERMA